MLSHLPHCLCKLFPQPLKASISLLWLPPYFPKTQRTSTSGQDELTRTKFAFLLKTTKKETKHMKKWFSRHHLATTTVISGRWESEVISKIVPAYCLESSGHSTEREKPCRDQQTYWVKSPEDQDSYGSKESRELHREKILERCREFSSRTQLSPAHEYKEIKEVEKKKSQKGLGVTMQCPHSHRIKNSACSHLPHCKI